MRITTGMMKNNYLKNLDHSANKLNYLNEKVSSGRKFFKASEDTVGAIKAYKLRREFKSTEMYDTNISNVDSFLTVAESNLTDINNSLQRVYTSYLQGVNGTMTADDREIIATEMDTLQDSILAALNAKFEDRYVFGGKSKNELPFSVDNSGNLLFKGVNVNDSTELTKLQKLSKESINIDLGLGMTFNNGSLNNDTVFDMSMAGIKFMGFGTDDGTVNGIPNNIYSLIGEIKEELRKTDFSNDDASKYIKAFEKQKSQVIVAITDIGSKANYLDFLKTRNEDYQFNLNEKISNVEYVDSAEAIMDFKMQEYSYNSALAMGNKILQNSFIDFMK
ncbi:MAG: flgL [Bacillota bacterium]|nr:flgL [Bacillota bacterium]